MLRKRFVIHQTDVKRKHRRIFFIVSNVLLFLGSMVLVSSFVYMLLHLNQSDTLIMLLMPFVVAGIGLMLVSQFIYPSRYKFRR